MQNLTRRELLLAAGGVTFLGLTRTEAGYILAPTAENAAGSGPARPLVYTAAPYIQPGPASRLVENDDSMAIHWQTEDRPASFTVEYGENGACDRRANVVRSQPYR